MGNIGNKINMFFNGVSHTTEGYATDAYREWCENIYVRNGRYDSPEVAEAKKRIAMTSAYAQLTKLTIVTTNHIFLTVNPPDTIDFYIFENHIKKLLGKKWISKYLLCYEQRGESDETKGKGFHAHILIEHTPLQPSHIKRELQNTLKDITDVTNYHILNIEHIDSNEATRKINYITSIKKDTEKHLKQKIDTIWREEMKLDHYYNMNYIVENASKNLQQLTSQDSEEL